MAKVKGGLLESVSGKLGPLVVVNRGERTYVRTAPQYTKDSWSERQVQNRHRFRQANAFCRQYQQQVIVPIWNQLPGSTSGYHQFLKANIPAFNSRGALEDQSMLHFSDGVLPLPYQLQLAAQGDQLALSWQNDSSMTGVRLEDELWYMTLSPEAIQGPFESGLKRGSKGGILNFSEQGESTGLFVFFASSDRKAFSPDRFLAI